MVFYQSLKLALLTGGISQMTGFIALYLTKSPLFSLIWIQIFGNIISYFAQSYAFGFTEIRSEIIIRWCISVAISLILNIKIYNYLVNIKKIKETREYIVDNYNNLVVQLYDFLMITVSIMIVFLICLYPLRKYYIFVKRNRIENHNLDLILLFGIYIYFYFDKLYNLK
jgi:hypothetical protein